MAILIYAEYNPEQNNLTDTSQQALNAAILLQKQIAEETPIDVILFTSEPPKIAKEYFKAIRNVFFVSNKNYEQQLTHIVAPLLIKLSANYNYIIAPNSSFGKANLPILAAHLNIGQISDVIEIITKDTFKRPIYTGNAIATVKANTKKILLTIRGSAFTEKFEALKNYEANVIQLEPVDNIAIKEVTFISEQQNKQSDTNLQSAKIIVAGGRGLQSSEDFTKQLTPLAKLLNAALGATRAAVDSGFAPNDWQIGQTGKIVAPNLYIAIGLSGAQQHIAGMKDSKTIISINNNAEEPIIAISDYALIGDLFEIIPKLIENLN